MSVQGKKLQTKSSKKANDQSKEETVAKVKAIREKQSQWMKEREVSKSSLTKLKAINKEHTPLPDVPKVRALSTVSSGSSEGSAHRNPYSNPRRKPLYPEPQRDHSDMVSWISKGDNPATKKQRPPSASGKHSRNPSLTQSSAQGDFQLNSKEYTPSNYRNSSSSGNLSSVALSSSKQTLHNKLRPSSRTSVKADTSYHGNDKLGSYHHVGDDNEENNLSRHGAVSDHLTVNRNQSNTTIPSETSSKFNTPELSTDMLNALADTVAQKLKASLQPTVNHKRVQQSVNDDTESDIASHFCPLCNKMMSGIKYTPMAAIPCGHTFCQSCLRECKKCPTCQTTIRSTAVNTVMQGIITDFKEQKEKERLQKLEEQTRQYVDEYQSLALRCNALNSEYFICHA